jgi:hypothetical protein
MKTPGILRESELRCGIAIAQQLSRQSQLRIAVLERSDAKLVTAMACPLHADHRQLRKQRSNAY